MQVSTENYTEQFKIFAESITNGGMLVYNEEDTVLNDLVEVSNTLLKNTLIKRPITKLFLVKLF